MSRPFKWESLQRRERGDSLSSLFKRAGRRGLRWPQIQKEMAVDGKNDKHKLRQQLDAMVSSGEIRQQEGCYLSAAFGASPGPSKGSSRANASRHFLTGRLSSHPDGFGFVRIEGRDKDLFLPQEQMRGLIDGDLVEVRAGQRRGRECGELIRVVEKADATMSGQFVIQGGTGLVMPRKKGGKQGIVIRGKASNGAKDGDWVRIELERDSNPPRGRVLEVLNNTETPRGMIELVIQELGVTSEFPVDAAAEAEAIPNRPTRSEVDERLDLRHLPLVTIDGADARDFDDAICVQARGDGFEVWVAIADVAHVVKPGSALDGEAQLRGNSFYFPDRAIPMLPESLSNGLCSLKPKVNRLVMAVRIRLDANGTPRSARAFEAVIRSRSRLTYDRVTRWLENGDARAVRDSDVGAMLQCAADLYRKLHQQRQRRGAIDFDSSEMNIVIDGDTISSITPRKQTIAHCLIEELMLLANTSVAHILEEAKRPAIYRVHPAPKRQDIDQLNEFLDAFGLRIPLKRDKDVRPGDVQRTLEAASDHALEHVLSRLVLRAMQQACYQTEKAPHFGLAYQSYCHFTSPIRRYADLLVHRQLKALLRKESAIQWKDGDKICQHISSQERVQQRAEWDCQAMLAALYHRRDIGEVLPARIAGMSKRRVFIEIEATGAEASLAVDDIAIGFTLDEQNHCLRNRKTGQRITLGDAVNIRIDSTDPVRGQVGASIILD
ncbi:MAG: ribonuclease R [Mariprofundales bacterium]|nr:ribonuclease R [Mariprofundales bacterium]